LVDAITKTNTGTGINLIYEYDISDLKYRYSALKLAVNPVKSVSDASLIKKNKN
jgi:hypothetical protein